MSSKGDTALNEEFPATMTLTEFLLARIAEDEAVANSNAEVSFWRGVNWASRPDLLHIRRHDPARVLAECEAKRQIVKRHRQSFDVCGGDCSLLQTSPCPTLQALAAVYSDHPDYRDEWRVGVGNDGLTDEERAGARASFQAGVGNKHADGIDWSHGDDLPPVKRRPRRD